MVKTEEGDQKQHKELEQRLVSADQGLFLVRGGGFAVAAELPERSYLLQELVHFSPQFGHLLWGKLLQLSEYRRREVHLSLL